MVEGRLYSLAHIVGISYLYNKGNSKNFSIEKKKLELIYRGQLFVVVVLDVSFWRL